MSYKIKLLEKIKSKQSKIAVVGLGYVGLPLCLDYAEQGYKVVGIDVDLSKIKILEKGKSYIKHISEGDVSEFINKNLFLPTNNFEEIKKVDAIIICVPTPLNSHREPDLSFIRRQLQIFHHLFEKDKL